MDLMGMRPQSSEMLGGMYQMMPPPPNERVLYVGNLSPDVDEGVLMEFFRKCSNPVACRLMRDIFTTESRRFGFVTFHSEEEARRAQELLNHERLDGSEIRIAAKRSPSDFKAQANVFIKNLAPQIGGRALQQLCSQFGPVLSCIIRCDDKGSSLGYGFVQFETEEAARKAIDSLNATELEGQQLHAQQFQPQRTRTSLLGTNVYIKNFPTEWKKDQIENMLREHMAPFGKIISLGVFTHTHPTLNVEACYAFVAFEKAEAAAAAIASLNDKDAYEVLGGEAPSTEERTPLYAVLAVSRRVRKEEIEKKAALQQTPTNIFVRSLKPETQKEDLERVFSKFGKVASISVKPMKAVEGVPLMSYGFVNFTTAAEAQTAVFEGKRDAEVLALLALAPSRDRNFLAFFQPKNSRAAYLKMRKNLAMSAAPRMQPMPMLPYGLVGPMPPFSGSRRPPAPYASLMPPTTLIPPISVAPPVSLYTPEWLKQNRKEFFELPRDKQKNILGKLVFDRIRKAGLAPAAILPKVAGMLSDTEILEYEEIVDLLENEEALTERVKEAVDIVIESISQSQTS